MYKTNLISLFMLSSMILCSVHGLSLEQFLERHYEVRDFFEYVKKHTYFNASLNYQPGTIFAPTNDALRIFKTTRTMKDKTLLYHYCNSPYMMKDLESKDFVTSNTAGNTALWLKKKGNQFFVNGALVTRHDLIFETSKKQIVHILDEVLEPTLRVQEDRGIDNPNAREFMEHPNYYDVIGDYRISKFQDQVNNHGKSYLFNNFTEGTYFIPIDRAFHTVSPSKLVPRVIEGHVIPDHAIFLRTAEIGTPVEAYRPTEFQANTPILITFKKDIAMGGDYRDMWFVNSDNRQIEPRYHKGVVQAEIVRGNIVVKNGVVHLISKPLVLIDTNVYETFEWYSTKAIWSMREFFKFVNENAKGFGIDQILRSSTDSITFFVPSDKAMRESEVLKSLTFQRNTTAIIDIIKSHIIHGGISSLEIADAIKKSKNHVIQDPMESHTLHKDPFQIPTHLKGRKLLFSMLIDEDGKRTFHVEGHGANATILQPDIGATNGYIHIIDKVLGIPDLKFNDKLASNPMLQLTNQLWKKEKLDSILNNTVESFTIFAPSERAWMNLRDKGSAGKAAYDGFFFGHPGEVAVKSFKRLVIPEHAYTIERLNELSRENATKEKVRVTKDNGTTTEPQYPLLTISGSLKVNSTKRQENYGPNVGVHEEVQYWVYWKNMKAHVVRPNVKCTNAIIHIIDQILMDDEEIAIASAQKQTFSLIGILSFSIITIFTKYVVVLGN